MLPHLRELEEPSLFTRFCSMLKHSRGEFAGKTFHLEPWQRAFADTLLFTKNDDGLRQFRRAFLAVPRKTGKTQLCAALGVYMLLMDGEPGAEIVVAAGDRSQAGILHTAAKHLIESCPALLSKCKIYRNSIVVEETRSSMQTVSSEAGTKHGLNPSCVLVDEMHVFREAPGADSLVDVLETGMGSRREPLTVYLTTAGVNINGPCYRLWEQARAVQEGRVEDPSLLPCIFEAPKDSDPFDIETAKACNPNFGVTVKEEYIRQWIDRAKVSVKDENTYRCLHLNQWVQSENRLFRAGALEACSGRSKPFGDRPVFCGLDLSSTTDTTAFVAVAHDDSDDSWDVHCKIFIPEETAFEKIRQDNVPYDIWERKGWVQYTEGDQVDYDVVKNYVIDFCDEHQVRGVAIDRWNATHLVTILTHLGIDVKPWGQGYASMSSATKYFETRVLAGRIRLDENKALMNHIANAAAKTDDAGNIKLVKPTRRSNARIDAAVALVMALGLAVSEAEPVEQDPEIFMV